ncbi:MAG TPA: EAL domain-containing protein [Thermoanaerobaculia bacterium]|jgi:diguanylate cyclase (GGDEF)-like protein|nr:EAL domain-containing protein [Thermoanaerobaculia bacterium]
MLVPAQSLDIVLRDIDPSAITPYFQPIVDLFTARVLGYEILSRGPAPFESPSMLFTRARQLGLTAELERACHTAAFSRIGEMDTQAQGRQWFVNVSPEVFCESDSAATAAEIRRRGLDPSQIVFEITERDAIVDHEQFQRAVRIHAEKGFRLALDDFGSGNSGLVTLVSCMPHVIKLDMELTRDVNVHPYKQNIVRAIVSLAASVDAQLIAEGVETWQELEMLVRQGVRFAQGYLFSAPLLQPSTLNGEVSEMLLRTMSRCSLVRSNVEEAVARLAVETFSLQRGAMTCGELESVFHADAGLDCAVVLEGHRPVGVITRAHLLAQMGGRFGYSLTEHKLIDSLAKPLTLSVDEGASIVRLATLAMERSRDDRYDPVVIVRNGGAYRGTVTMRQLIMRAAELELQQARDSNPLTLLPGNRQIQSWVTDALESGGTLLYADLDRFKEFNDAFGFVLGDDAIRVTAQVLDTHLQQLCPGARLGHLGGDDFVVVAPGSIDSAAVALLCAAFDEAKRVLFDEETLLAREFWAEDRRGVRSSVPVTTLSIAVVPTAQLGRSAHPALLAQIAAALKKRAKVLSSQRGCSSFVLEQP